MTTPTNGGPNDEAFEERLAASFDRATNRAQGDLADGRLAVEAIDRGRRRSAGAVWRAGLVLAAVALLGVGTIFAVGGRPGPSPIASVAVTAPSDAAAASLNQSEVLQTPVAEPSVGTQVPEVPVGASFPHSVDGQPLYAVGGPAERQIAQTSDATEFSVSGWLLPLERPTNCDFPALPTMASDGVTFDSCATETLFAGPGGGASVSFLYSMTNDRLDWASTDTPDTRVRQIAVRAHTHDGSCAGAYCAVPVVDQVVIVGDPVINPILIAGSPPPKVAPISLAISNGYDYAQELIDGNGGATRGAKPVFLAAEFGTAAALGDFSVQAERLTTWEWKVVFASSDSYEVVTVWEDATTAVSSHQDSRSGDPYLGP